MKYIYKRPHSPIILILGILLAAVMLSTILSAAVFLPAPTPPIVIVNHALKQCAMISGGDECIACTAPPGWEVVGFSPDAQCPIGYTEVQIEPVCERSKSLRCCLPGHSGAQGDCLGWALDGLLCLTPVIVILGAIIGLVVWLVRRRKRKKPSSD